MSPSEKEALKKEVIARLAGEREILRIVLFGSFQDSDAPNDMDVAVFQDSSEDYYSLAMKYRRLLRPVARHIPVDVIPLRSAPERTAFLAEIEKGEVLYER
jgi:predicted nucleotidyltransferase